MQEARTWRELLRQIINDNLLKQRLIEVLKVTPTTLTRWVNGESVPRPQNLHRLAAALPQYREDFHRLMREELGDFEEIAAASEEVQHTIPSEFYIRVLSARATTNENLRYWSTCHLILRQALGQLDPDRQGMSIWITCCMPPSGPFHKVRSLRESVGLGTHPWAGNLEQDALFLGAESLSGNVVTRCRPSIIQDIEKEHTLIAIQRDEFERSTAIYPLLDTGKIAGVLLVSSVIPNYFQSQARTDLVQRYANLVTLAFEPRQFYTPEQIALCVMPDQQEQKKHFLQFRQIVQRVMIESSKNRNPVNNQQADMIAWQHMEEELILASESGTTDDI
jgi:Helix-turn-helix.